MSLNADNEKSLNADNEKSLNAIIENAVKSYWYLIAFTNMGGTSYTFAQVAEQVEKLHIIFEAAGINPGDKVAICGKNSAEWAIVFIACLTSGTVAVPVLHEFSPENIHNLVTHSEAKLMFVDEAIWNKLDENKLPNLLGAFYLSELGFGFSRSRHLVSVYERLNEEFSDKFPEHFAPEDISYYHDQPDELCVINYTSGSTGASKGVMLPYRSIWSNIRYSIDHLDFLKPGDGMVNMLPLGHLYGMVIEMLHPFVKGCHCYFLTKAPSPKVLLQAFAEIRPKLIITVPLVLDKIIRNNVFPKIKTTKMRFSLALPIIKDKIYAKIKEELIKVFGGEVREIIIGGAPLNPEVETFLYKIHFPITVGYGMTECGPLITYAPPEESKPHTVGRIVDRMEVKIDSPNPKRVPGNILVRGDNVMQGYYKNPQATAEAFSLGDGWMNTGDMGMIDKDGMITICGRSKTMILGPSGQNIYPEEIEHIINSMPLVAESLVIEENGKLVALIFPDHEAAAKQGLNEAGINKVMEDNIKHVNQKLEKYNRLNSFRLMENEFEKTPKRSIKRFLYQQS